MIDECLLRLKDLLHAGRDLSMAYYSNVSTYMVVFLGDSNFAQHHPAL
jgi:hypothetical protein